MSQLWTGLAKRPPIIFPLISVFLFLMTVLTAFDFNFDNDIAPLYRYRALVMLVYFLLWIGANFYLRWAAISFVLATVIHFALYLFLKEDWVGKVLDNAMVAPLPTALALSIIILFYFRRMLRPATVV